MATTMKANPNASMSWSQIGLYGLSGLQAGLGIMSGMAQESSFKLDAAQAGIDAKERELDRRRQLQDALAMQQVIVGASGRAGGEGSVQQIIKQDKSKAKEDIDSIRASGKSKQASLRSAGKSALTSSITSGIMSGAKSAYKTSQIKKG